MAKKNTPVTIDLDIKLADSKSKKAAKSDRLIIDSPTTTITNPKFDSTRKASATNLEEIQVPVVDCCVSIAQEIESLQSQLKLYEADVIDVAKTSKKEEEDNDNFVKTIDVKGTEFKLQIQFRDAYSKMDISMRDPLKQIFGEPKYAIMFTEEKTSTIRPEKLEALKTLLGDRYDDFIQTDECVKPSKEFQYNYFVMRKSLKADQLATVQKVLDACQSNPSVKYPK